VQELLTAGAMAAEGFVEVADAVAGSGVMGLDDYLADLRDRALVHEEKPITTRRINLVDESNKVLHALDIDEEGGVVALRSYEDEVVIDDEAGVRKL